MKNFTSYFIAIPVPEQFRDILFSVADELRKIIPSTSVLDMRSSHITLYYLTQEAEGDLVAVERKVKMLSTGLKSSVIRVGNPNVFNNTSPVLFLDVDYPVELRNFNWLLDQSLSRYRAEDNDLPFHPHITIAAMPTGSVRPLLKGNESIVEKLSVNITFPVTELAIYGADSRNTPEYQERLTTIALQ